MYAPSGPLTKGWLVCRAVSPLSDLVRNPLPSVKGSLVELQAQGSSVLLDLCSPKLQGT